MKDIRVRIHELEAERDVEKRAISALMDANRFPQLGTLGDLSQSGSAASAARPVHEAIAIHRDRKRWLDIEIQRLTALQTQGVIEVEV